MEDISVKEERVSDDEDTEVNEEKMFLALPFKVEYSVDNYEYKDSTDSGSCNLTPKSRLTEEKPITEKEIRSQQCDGLQTVYKSSFHNFSSLLSLQPGHSVQGSFGDSVPSELRIKPTSRRGRPRSYNVNGHEPLHAGQKTFECDECKQRFNRRKLLIVHQRSHTGEKPFECYVCERRFSQKPNLKAHLRTHTGEKPYECSECKQRFVQKGQLTQHQRVHSGEKPYVCELCNQKFSHKNSLDSHQLTHTGVKPFECEWCQQKFAQRNHLKEHRRMHTGERPFQCEVCKKTFARRFNLKVHARTHTGERPFDCGECNRSFSLKYCLEIHQRTHDRQKRIFLESGQKVPVESSMRNVETVIPFECDVEILEETSESCQFSEK